MYVFFPIPVIFNVIQKKKKKQIKNILQSRGFWRKIGLFGKRKRQGIGVREQGTGNRGHGSGNRE